uniref:Reverse transcriptase n=1 Tax=Solanum tuberosum TaxID=4113 RepID=M1C832_SOLTU
MVVRSAILYGEECWPVKNSHVQKLRVAEMRMSGWMCGYTMRDRIRNEVILNKVGVTSMMDKMREVKLGWFEHVKRR